MKKALLSAAIVLALMLLIPMAGLAEIVLNDVTMEVGKYLPSNADALTDTKPADNYAVLTQENGEYVLTLHNYQNNKTHLYTSEFTSALYADESYTLRLEGTSTLVNHSDDCVTMQINADLTITGSGTLNLDGKFGIYGYPESSITVTGGTLNIHSASYARADTFTISGGSVSLSAPFVSISTEYFNMESGSLTIRNTSQGIQAFEKATFSGGYVDIISEGVAIEGDNGVTISGGVLDLNSAGAMSYGEIICTLPMPEGVEIFTDLPEDGGSAFRLLANREAHENGLNCIIHLPATAPAPGADTPQSLPTTGDRAPLTLWLMLSMLSLLGGMAVLRKRSEA